MKSTFMLMIDIAFSVYLTKGIEGEKEAYENSIESLQQMVHKLRSECKLNENQSIVIMRIANGYYSKGGN